MSKRRKPTKKTQHEHIFYYSADRNKKKCTACRKRYKRKTVDIDHTGFILWNSMLISTIATFYYVNLEGWSGSLAILIISFGVIWFLNGIIAKIINGKHSYWVRDLE